MKGSRKNNTCSTALQLEPSLELSATFTERQRARALARFALLRPHLEEKVPLATLALTSPVSLRTLRWLLHDYREEGLQGLAPQRRMDCGQSRGVSEDLVLLIEGLALQIPRRPPFKRS